MRATITVLLACGGLTLLAGCGSSATGTTAATAVKSSPAPTSGLKATTTPTPASPSASAPVQSGLVEVAYRNVTISPDTLRVKLGSTIKWTDYDNLMHNVTSLKGPQQFGSQDFGQGSGFSVKLTKPGVINYECSLHPASMNGTIEVVK